MLFTRNSIEDNIKFTLLMFRWINILYLFVLVQTAKCEINKKLIQASFLLDCVDQGGNVGGQQIVHLVAKGSFAQQL